MSTAPFPGTIMATDELRLSFPAHEIPDVQSLNPAPRHLAAWLASFRVGDFDDAAERLLNVLHNYNRCPMKPVARYQFLEQLQPVIYQYADALSDRLSGNTFPLAEKPRAKYQLIAALIREGGYGYKQVIHDFTRDANKIPQPAAILAQAVFQAAEFLSKYLLAAYSAYVPEPEGVWGELHRLYDFSERNDLLGHQTGKTAATPGDGDSRTIKHLYKRIVLLYLANPYHLMCGEAATI
ncbi:MAG: hypothetical protein HY273_13245, partial [Gammaproteobacteria bacterium]|nr:hypothetical protein [Gammaproteobacteria bacterium]